MSQFEEKIAKALASGQIDTQVIADLTGIDERQVKNTLESIAPYVRDDNVDKILLEQIAQIRSGLSKLDESNLLKSHVDAIGAVLNMIENQAIDTAHSPESVAEAQRLHRSLARRIPD